MDWMFLGWYVLHQQYCGNLHCALLGWAGTEAAFFTAENPAELLRGLQASPQGNDVTGNLTFRPGIIVKAGLFVGRGFSNTADVYWFMCVGSYL
jgi:hypothetical protein